MDGLERVLVAHARVGDRVIVEDPCYTGVLRLVRALALEPVAAAIDDRGIRPGDVARALRAGARVCILTPRAQNPLGAAFDRDRATELLAVLAAYPSALVVENDHAGAVAGTPYYTLTEGRERWGVVRSVSKTLGPDLRLGVLAADELTVHRVEGRQVVGCGWVSHLLQRAVAGLWSDAAVHASLRRAAASYAERRDQLVAALADRGVPSTARSGLNVYIPVAEEVQAMRALLTRGWLLRAGEPYRIHSQPFVRATIALIDRNEIDQLAGVVAESLAPHRGTQVA
jgi:DNA-binding transcriptional MocR family regulator